MKTFNTLQTVSRDINNPSKITIFFRKLRNKLNSLRKSKINFTDRKVVGAWTRHQNVERKFYERDLLQPFKRDGTPNEKFQRAYGHDHPTYIN